MTAPPPRPRLVVYSALAPMAVCVAITCGCAVDLGPERRPVVQSCDNSRMEWVARFGDASGQLAGGASHDGQGGAYLTGAFQGAIDLGSGKMVSAGAHDFYLARIDANGDGVWSRRFGDAGDQLTAGRVAATSEGGVILARRFTGTVDFGDGERVADGEDGFVSRYDATGEHRWTRVFGGQNAQTAHSIAVDALDATFVVGSFREDLLFEGEQLARSHGMLDAFVAKLDSEGALEWLVTYGGSEDDFGNAVAATGDGVVFGGQVHGSASLTLAPASTPGPGGPSSRPDPAGPGPSENGTAFLVRLADDGRQQVWSTLFPGDDGHKLTSVLPLASGDLMVGGHGRPEGFGGGPPETSFFARVSGELGAVHEHVSLPHFYFQSTTIDPDGEMLVAGGTYADYFGDGQHEHHGDIDGVVTKLDSDFLPRWVVGFGSVGFEDARGIAVTPASGAIVQGHFADSIDIDGCPVLHSAGGTDIVLGKARP
jgi:hypothetical protein